MDKITNINIDSKSILIIIFLGFSLFFGYKWYFSSSDRKDWKQKVEQLDKENSLLKIKRDSLQSSLSDLIFKYDSITHIDSILQVEISELEIDIINSKKSANKTLIELNSIKKELEKNKKKIIELENNPPNKTDNDLIESLKNKLNQ